MKQSKSKIHMPQESRKISNHTLDGSSGKMVTSPKMVTESKMESKTMSQELQSVMNAFLGHGNDGRYTENNAGFKGCGI